MYYLRFTDTAKEDLERGTSLKHSGLDSSKNIESVAELFGCDADSIELFDGLYVQILNGLYGYELQYDILKYAIEEVDNNYYQFSNVGKATIFNGIDSSDAKYVTDGDLFIPKSIAYSF